MRAVDLPTGGESEDACETLEVLPFVWIESLSGSSSRFCVWSVAETHPRTATVFVDEHHASGFEGAANCKRVGDCKRNVLLGNFSAPDCIHAQGCLASEIL